MKFEYKQIILDLGMTLGKKKQEAANETINELGRDGWELIAAINISQTTSIVYVFKRPLLNEF